MVERVVMSTLDVAFKLYGHIQMAGFAILYATVSVSWLWLLKETVFWLVAPATS